MTIDYQHLRNRLFPEIRQSYSRKDVILYALGVGIGQDPLDADQLRFVYEENIQVLPTMAVVLGHPGFWLREPDTGIDWKRSLHGEQSLVLHRPLPSEGVVIGRTRIDEIIDKGPGRGAIVYSSRELRGSDGSLYAEITQSSFCRADGGFGGPSGPARAPSPVPERNPDSSITLFTRPETALIYRLSGDYNPLHVDPAVAAAANFPRPVLHGLATYGIAGHGLLKLLCGYDPARFRRMDVRFSSPVFPGETIRVDIWNEFSGRVAFRATVTERGVVALSNGRFEYVP